jgi:RNA polymerase sigma-70 factor (ECF subfamily)
MRKQHDIVARWVAREILPHEGRVRAWLSRQWRGAIDIDDVVQEAYCRLSALASVDHIENPLAYFRRTAHAAAVDAIEQWVFLPAIRDGRPVRVFYFLTVTSR